MGYQVGSICYETAAEAATASRWAMGHDTTMLVGGVPHLLQVFPVTDGNGTRMNWKLTRMTDYVEVNNESLTYDPPSCGVAMDPERMADMLQLWGWMLLPVILVWGGRKLYEFFDRTPHEAG